jgi:hypothetical protein
MEKGNEVSGGGAAGVAAVVAAGALINTGPSAATGAGASVNATTPRKPWDASTTNPDGSTTTISRDATGARTVTKRDKNGKVTGTETVKRDADGTRSVVRTDADGKTSTGTYDDFATSTKEDGTKVERWETGYDETVIDTYGKDGKLTESQYSSDDGSGTVTFNPDGSGTDTFQAADGTTSTYDFDGKGKATLRSAPNPPTGKS